MTLLRLLILSSTEGLDLAGAVQTALTTDRIETTIWNQLLFLPGQSILDTILTTLPQFDASIVVLTEDDDLHSRGRPYKAPRDNLIFELGASVATLGPACSFVLVPDEAELKLPSDIAGLIQARYRTRRDGNLLASITPACTAIQRALLGHGTQISLTWRQYGESIAELNHRVFAHDIRGGFRPDILVGVEPGGAIIAGLLATLNRRALALITLDPRRPPTPLEIQSIRTACADPQRTYRLLLVDDSYKTGTAMNEVRRTIDAALTGREFSLAAAVLVYRKEFRDDASGLAPTYFIHTTVDHLPYSPV